MSLVDNFFFYQPLVVDIFHVLDRLGPGTATCKAPPPYNPHTCRPLPHPQTKMGSAIPVVVHVVVAPRSASCPAPCVPQPHVPR